VELDDASRAASHAVLETLGDDAVSLVTEHRPAVEALAGALLERKWPTEIGGMEATAIIRRS
jgi:hypothetical protein